MEIADMGPFRAILMQAAVVSMEISYIWAVLDQRTNTCVSQGMHKTSVAAALIGGPEDAMRAVQECREKAEVDLKRIYEDWEVEQIVLGGDGTD